MPRELKGWARPRPLRVAFLVEDGEHANLVLDGIFADCYDRWGGRFSLIAPCLDGRIAPSYWPWLEAYDPDIVYSYVSLSRADILEVHERLSPARYAFHKLDSEPRLDPYGFKPSYEFSPLSSLSVIFRLARYAPIAEVNAMKKAIPALNEEGPQRLLTNQDDTLVVLERQTEGREERAFIFVNTHAHVSREIVLETLLDTSDSGISLTDLSPGHGGIVGTRLAVEPLGVRVLRACRSSVERPVGHHPL
jgi:hypothetical protein